MDSKDYIDNLKSTNLRPGKVRIKEHSPKVIMEQEDKGDLNLKNKIIEWFMKNPYPKDADVHKFSEEMGIDTHEFEGHIYGILSSILSEGKSKGKDKGYDLKQVEMGTKVELEHTPFEAIARKITWDHLDEIPDYYTRLAKMEKSAGVSENVKVLQELFIQASEIEAMNDGMAKDLAMLRLSMVAELDAVNLYMRFVDLASDENVSKLMADVAKEEKTHAGEFESLMEYIDPNFEEQEEEGEKEVEDLTGLDLG